MKVSDFYKKKPTRSDGFRSSQDIVVSATRLIAAMNEIDLTTEVLEKDSGYSSGTIFKRFSSKKNIYRAVIAHTYDRMFASVADKLSSEKNLDVNVASEIIVYHYYYLLGENKPLLKRLLEMALRDSDIVKLVVKQQYRLCADLIGLVKLKCEDATLEPTTNIVPVFNGTLFGSFRSANLAQEDGADEKQAQQIKKSLRFILQRQDM